MPWNDLAQAWVERKEAASSADQARRDAQLANWIALAGLVIAAISMILAVFKH